MLTNRWGEQGAALIWTVSVHTSYLITTTNVNYLSLNPFFFLTDSLHQSCSTCSSCVNGELFWFGSAFKKYLLRSYLARECISWVRLLTDGMGSQSIHKRVFLWCLSHESRSKQAAKKKKKSGTVYQHFCTAQSCWKLSGDRWVYVYIPKETRIPVLCRTGV